MRVFMNQKAVWVIRQCTMPYSIVYQGSLPPQQESNCFTQCQQPDTVSNGCCLAA